MREGRQRAARGSTGWMCLLVTVASLGMKSQREHVWFLQACLALGGHRHDFPTTHPVRFPLRGGRDPAGSRSAAEAESASHLPG